MNSGFPNISNAAANNPISIMGTVILVIGVVLLVTGVFLAVALKGKQQHEGQEVTDDIPLTLFFVV